jgi:hypothetical protein
MALQHECAACLIQPTILLETASNATETEAGIHHNTKLVEVKRSLQNLEYYTLNHCQDKHHATHLKNGHARCGCKTSPTALGDHLYDYIKKAVVLPNFIL